MNLVAPFSSDQLSPLCLLDRQGVILHINQAWRDYAHNESGTLWSVAEGTNYLEHCTRLPEATVLYEGMSRVLTGETPVFESHHLYQRALQPRRLLARVIRVEEKGDICALVIFEDLTDYHRLKLRNDQNMNLVLHHARCVIWSGTVRYLGDLKFDWQVAFVSEEIAKALFPIRQASGQSFFHAWYQARPAEDRASSDRISKNCIRIGKDYSNLFRCRLASGKVLWVKEDVSVQVIEEGFWRVVGVCTDVTEHKQTELDMQKLITGARCLVWNATIYAAQDSEPIRLNDDLDPSSLHWEINVSNEAAAAEFLPMHLSPGQRYTDVWMDSRFSEDLTGMHQRATRAVWRSENYSQEYRCRTKDGKVVWIKEDVQVERIEQGQWQATGVCTDITDLKIASERIKDQEQQLRVALEAGGLGVWHMNTDSGQFRLFSERMRVLHEFEADEPINLHSFLMRIHPEDIETFKKSIFSRTPEDPKFMNEYRIILKNPDITSNKPCVKWLGSRGEVLFSRDGNIIGITGASGDISERKLIEEERARALQEARERADRDHLTGLLNHRTFYKRLEFEGTKAIKEKSVLALCVLDLDNFKFFNDVYGHLVGDEVLRQLTQQLRLACRSEDILARFGGDEFAIIMPGIGSALGGQQEVPTLSEIEYHLKTHLQISFQPEGYPSPIPITVSLGSVVFDGTQWIEQQSGNPRLSDSSTSPNWQELVAIADERLRHAKLGGDSVSVADEVRSRTSQLIDGFSMLNALVTSVDNKDRYTKRHSEDVMIYALQIAKYVGLDEEVQQQIAVSALLHDVGKIGVPDAILRKPGKLTDSEYEAIQQHAEMGAAIVGAVPGLEYTLDAIRHHHERWDGKGYPSGLSKENIPWMARLMAVVDAFSAMTTDRPYRQGMSTAKAQTILGEGAGSQWDPYYVQAFLNSQKAPLNVPEMP